MEVGDGTNFKLLESDLKKIKERNGHVLTTLNTSSCDVMRDMLLYGLIIMSS